MPINPLVMPKIRPRAPLPTGGVRPPPFGGVRRPKPMITQNTPSIVAGDTPPSIPANESGTLRSTGVPSGTGKATGTPPPNSAIPPNILAIMAKADVDPSNNWMATSKNAMFALQIANAYGQAGNGDQQNYWQQVAQTLLKQTTGLPGNPNLPTYPQPMQDGGVVYSLADALDASRPVESATGRVVGHDEDCDCKKCKMNESKDGRVVSPREKYLARNSPGDKALTKMEDTAKKLKSGPVYDAVQKKISDYKKNTGLGKSEDGRYVGPKKPKKNAKAQGMKNKKNNFEGKK